MKFITLLQGQSFADVALAQYGSVDGLAWIIQDNPSIEISYPVEGQQIRIRPDVIDAKIKAIFKNLNKQPASL
jgi:hypothetical protein